jgi:hypothetical protein
MKTPTETVPRSDGRSNIKHLQDPFPSFALPDQEISSHPATFVRFPKGVVFQAQNMFQSISNKSRVIWKFAPAVLACRVGLTRCCHSRSLRPPRYMQPFQSDLQKGTNFVGRLSELLHRPCFRLMATKVLQYTLEHYGRRTLGPWYVISCFLALAAAKSSNLVSAPTDLLGVPARCPGAVLP